METKTVDSKMLDEERESPIRSNFNLQGPYWKNRTNDIFKHDRDKRKCGMKLEMNAEKDIAFKFPSLQNKAGKEKRKQYDFRFFYIMEDEANILKEIKEMGINNYIETSMSLRSIELKKHLEVVTREY